MKIDINKIVGTEKIGSRIQLSWLKEALNSCGFIIDDDNEQVVITVLLYFLRHEKFFESPLLKNNPSFYKGLLIFGDYGVGKTMLFESLWSIGRKLILDRGISDLWFNKISAGSFVEKYMEQVGMPNEIRTMYIEDFYKGRLYIDDLGFEKLAFNKTELFADILFERHKRGSVTLCTTNLNPSSISDRYGVRIGDRLTQMFNVINWKGESRRV